MKSPKTRRTQAGPQVVIGLDMETDVGSFTPFYEGLIHGTPRVLDVLERHQAQATFFFVGEVALAHPKVVQTVAASGHEIGTHTLHYGECSVTPNPFIVKNCGAVAVREFDRLLSLFEERGARFWTARDLAKHWTTNHPT